MAGANIFSDEAVEEIRHVVRAEANRMQNTQGHRGRWGGVVPGPDRDAVGVLLSLPAYSWSTANADLELLSWNSDEIVLWSGNSWVRHKVDQSSPPSIAASDKSADTTYTIYAYFDKPTQAVKIETGATPRAITVTDGVCTKTGDKTRRFMGIARTNATPKWEDSETKRYIANYYNMLTKDVVATVNTGGTADTDVISVVDDGALLSWFIWLGYQSRITNSTVTNMPTAALKFASTTVATGYGLTLTSGTVTAYDCGLSLSYSGFMGGTGSGKLDWKVVHSNVTTIQAGTFVGGVFL